MFYTNEYTIYDRLTQWGYDHHTVNYSQSEYARDEDCDDFHEIHVNTMEGFLVALTFLASTASQHFAGTSATLSGFL